MCMLVTQFLSPLGTYFQRDGQCLCRGRAGKVAPRPMWAPSVTAFLVCNAVKTTVVVFTYPSGDII